MPADIAAALAAADARLGAFGQRIRWYSELSSTNDVASELAHRGAPEGAVVMADAQTAGRGRQGRTWCSPTGAGLYVSVVLRPHESMAPLLSLLTLAAGVSLVEGLQAATGLRPVLKWPNDVWVGDRKLGGILAEAGSSPHGLQHVVLGFGINVSPAAFPPDVAARSSSLEVELGRAVDRGLVLAECLAALSARYTGLGRDGGASVLQAWREAARPMLRRAVEWEDAGQILRGVAEDVDDTGALIVRTPSGRERIIAGEVRWM